MKKRLATLLVAMAVVGGPAAGAGLRSVDDSYTASRRFNAYKVQYPDLRLPELTFSAGQKIQFDRLYKMVDDRELHLDVFMPGDSARGERPSVVLVHGGGWRAGDKSEFYPLANMLAQRGYVVFLPEYRLSPEARFPAGLIDINDAIVWIKAQASTYGIDPARIALGGGSSGGQMAALLAYSAGEAKFKSQPTGDTRVSALIDLDGVLDFTSPLALQYENAAGDTSVAALWLGGSMEHATDQWREASAARYVGERSPPTLIISSGELRFTAGKDAVLSALESRGIRHEYVELKNVPHTFWLFEPHLSMVAAQIDSFLKSIR